MNNYKIYSPSVLRLGISIVMLWFGSQQLLHPEMWTSFLPDWTSVFGFSQITFIYLNGLMEIVLGLALLLGFFVRISSLILAIHMLGIIFSLGYDAIAVRDFGIFVALVSIFINGNDSLSLENKLKNNI